MRIIARIATLCAAFAVAASATAAETVTYRGRPGSKMRIEGTSTIHDWHAESVLLSGSLALPADFPAKAASREFEPGALEATANVIILARSFKSSSGAAMDSVMQNAMDAKKYPRIEFKLKELVFKEFADDGMRFDAKGDLTVHGQTKEISMPVTIQQPDQESLKISGSTDVKMTEFGIQPPAPKILLGAIRTGDDVKLIFEWNVAKASPTGA